MASFVSSRFGTELWLSAAGLSLALASGCSDRTGQGDQAPVPEASPLGQGQRIRDVQKPGNAAVDKFVDITAASVVAVDQYDETNDGKARGTIYVQDLGSTEDFSGISLFSATLVPASLRLSVGDVVDLRGKYAEVTALGSFSFPKDTFIPQLVQPVTRFRFESAPIVPKVIENVDDLGNFAKARKWIGMLVTVNDVIAASPVVVDPPSGRASIIIAKSLPGTGLTTEPTITNELMPLDKELYRKSTKFKSVTGVVTFFVNLHIAPRTPADLQIEP